MLSEKLIRMPLFKKRAVERANAPIVIGKAVRNLVLAMRMYEVCGVMTRDQIERCVLREMEHAEWMYYGLDKNTLEALVEMERRNDKTRRNNR